VDGAAAGAGKRAAVNKNPLGLPLGMNRNVPNAIYHQRIRGLVSKGAIDILEGRSPAHYVAWLEGVSETTPALEFGSAFHCALLEPERFGSEYVSMPDFGDRRFKENKARYEAWATENAGKRSLGFDVADAIKGMVASVRRHPLAGRMIEDGIPELTLTWNDEDTGLGCKVRPDYYVKARRMVVDVKSARDASPDGFRKAVAEHRYHVQDALYRAAFAAVGEPVEHFIFVAVEKEPPFAVGIYTLDAEGVGRGYSRARSGIDLMAECMKTNTWPAYAPGIQTIELPPWAA
jgi:PDDEXK-like domain of unknown function (DUF3799)